MNGTEWHNGLPEGDSRQSTTRMLERSKHGHALGPRPLVEGL